MAKASARQGNGGGGQLTVHQQRDRQLQQFTSFVDTLAPNMNEAAARGVDQAKLKRITLTAVNKSPDLLECSQKSWITALMQCAQDGLMPDGREAAFVKFKGDVVYMPMVYGLRKKILQSGEIKDIFTAVVYEEEFGNGLFEVELGSSPKIMHKPMLGRAERGEIIAAYSVATFKDGTMSFEVMTRAEIDRVMAVSRAKDAADGPWKQWYDQMARKTVLRRHAKSLPQSSDSRDVEVEAMFGDRFDRAIGQRDEDRTLRLGERTTALPASETRAQVDDIEARATGAQVDVPHDEETGEIRDEGASTTKGERTDDDGVDWDKWLSDVKADVGQVSDAKLEKWKAPKGCPTKHVREAQGAIADEIARRKGDADDAPELTEELAARAQISEGGKVVREATGTLTKDTIEQEPEDVDWKAAADDVITMFNKPDMLLMDLRALKTRQDPNIDKMPAEEQERVIAAFRAREDQLSARPK